MALASAVSVIAPTTRRGRNRLRYVKSELGRCSAVTSQSRLISSLTRLRPTNPVPPVTKAARRALSGIRLVLCVRIVAQDGRQPAFSLAQCKSLAHCIVSHLIAVDFADAEIMRLRVREIKSADGSRRK